jgi:hypothetical protein
MPHGMNGSNGVNGFGARQRQGVWMRWWDMSCGFLFVFPLYVLLF